MNFYTSMFENRDIPFNEFIWRVARRHMPLIHMRDDGSDAPIHFPNDSSDQNYYQQKLEEAITKKNELLLTSPRFIQQQIDTEYQDRQQHARTKLDQRLIYRQRLEKMLAQFEAWVPPTSEHFALKDETITMLKEELKDTLWYENYYQTDLDRPKMSAEEWIKQRLEALENDIQYNQEHSAKEDKSIDYVINWIQDLDTSVPVPAHLKGFPSKGK